MTAQAAVIRAISYCLPERFETVEDLAREHPEWPVERIFTKTGITGRHLAAEDECASDLAVRAAQDLFASGACIAADIDFVLFCTQTPDYLLPTTACVIQDRLDIPRTAGALDFNLGCSGYVYGLSLAKGLVETGQAKRLLLLTADTYSKLIHPDDRSVRTLFGDAGAATLIEAAPDDGVPGIGPFVFGTDGRGANNLIVPQGGLRHPTGEYPPEVYTDYRGNRRSDRNLYMNGREIVSFAVEEVPKAVRSLLDKAELEVVDLDGFVFHQASALVLERVRKRCKLPEERFFYYLESIGNTVSCSIPIALKKGVEEGRVSHGDRLMLVGFGVGYSWGATLVRWLPRAAG